MKTSSSVQKNKKDSSITNRLLLKTIGKALVLSLSLSLTAACVVTPNSGFGVVDGSFDGTVGVGADMDFTPQILTADNSFVTVRIGPRFFASDAYLLAYNHCLNRGLYAYEVSPWSHSASIVRDLRYDCRPSYIAPPMVYHIDRSNRFRYDYFNNYYFRHHRPNHHFRPPSTGWWGRNHYNPSLPTPDYRQPPQIYQGPGYTRDGRATTPSSPRTYNPGKDRYSPRNGYDPNIYSPPVSNTPVNSKPSWWGRGNNNQTPNTPPPSKYESPRHLPRTKYESRSESKYDSKYGSKYESRGDSKFGSKYDSPTVSPSAPSVNPRSESKPSFWGKPKDSSNGGSIPTPSRGSVASPGRGSYENKYSSRAEAKPSRSFDRGTLSSESRDSNSSRGSRPSWMR